MWNSLTIPWQFVALLPMLSVTHIMPVLVLLSVVTVGMHSFRPLFPDKIYSLTLPRLLVKSLMFHWQLSVPDISRFSIDMVTLTIAQLKWTTATNYSGLSWLKHAHQFIFSLSFFLKNFCLVQRGRRAFHWMLNLNWSTKIKNDKW